MHYVNNDDKFKQTIIRFSVYAVMALLIYGLTSLLVLVARGYDVDRSTGEVINNGLLFIESSPAKSDIFIDGRVERSKTSAQLPLPEGNYDVELILEDYRPWSKNVEIIGSEVNWIYYPRLVPQVVTSEAFPLSFEISDLLTSPTGDKTVSTSSLFTQPQVEYADIRDDRSDVNTLVLLPYLTPSIDGSYGTIELLEWSQDERFVVVRHTNQEGAELLLLDVNSINNSRNLSNLFDVDLGRVSLTRDNNVFLSLRDSMLFLHRINEVSTELVAGNVSSVYVEDDTIFITHNGGTRLSRNTNFDDNFTILHDNEEVISIIDFAEFDNEDYVAVNQGQNQVAVYRNMQDSTTQTNRVDEFITLNEAIETIEFSLDGRFLLVQSVNESKVFDFEQDQEFTIERGYTAAPLEWLGESRLLGIRDDVAVVMDFDGLNRYDIVLTSPEITPFVNQEESFLYSSTRLADTNQLVLQRSALLIDN